MLSSTQRFSNRIENYVKYRPHYPHGVIEVLQNECGLTPEHIIADIGSGTGILTSLFLENSNLVYAVEPNDEMRGAAEELLNGNSQFSSVNGTAEATTLQPDIADFVVAGQAFHWFEPVATRREFERILRPNGWVALIWNHRLTVTSPFQKSYNDLLKLHAPEYLLVTHERVDADVLSRFFAPSDYQSRQFPNHQEFDLESLRGRLLSSSYAPLAGQPGYDELMVGLDKLFAQYNESGQVRFEYSTELFFGQL